MSMNLHGIVRNSINRVYADQAFQLFRSCGQANLDDVPIDLYLPPVEIKGNLQSEGDSALSFADLAGDNTIIRRLYVYASNDASERPWGLYRPLARSGDILLDAKGVYWKVLAVLEDFSEAGWESLRVQMQNEEPGIKIRDPNAKEEETEEKEEEEATDAG